MNENDIKTWIEKYFEGLTSLDEEQKLRDYFRQENIPQDLEMYKALFQYFTSERDVGNVIAGIKSEAIREKEITSSQATRNDGNRFSLFLRWGSVAAAACLLLFISLRLFLNEPETSQAYIDGKKYTDIELIRTETLKSLENLSEGSEDAYSSQIEALETFTK